MNLHEVRAENRRAVLSLLNKNGEMSRKKIANALHLTPAAITKISKELIDDGKIEESGEDIEEGRSGRRGRNLKLSLENKPILGITADTSEITYSVSYPDGTLVTSKTVPFDSSLENVISYGIKFIRASGYKTEDFIGCGVCTVGSKNGGEFSLWKDVDIESIFLQGLKMPVCIENNVRAFSMAEVMYAGGEESGSVLVVKWGPGIGSAAISNGEVVSGRVSTIAEMGHYIVDPDGEMCRCGRRGCLETIASSEALTKALGIQSLSEISLDKDLSSSSVIFERINAFALALMNTATIIDSEKIILYGSVFDNESVHKLLTNICLRYNPLIDENAIQVSCLNDKRSYIGSTAIAAARFFFE